MVMLPHASLGAFLGSNAPGPASAFAMGAASHFVLDAVPHADYPLERRSGKLSLALDTALALGASIAIYRASGNRNALAGALGGVAPDLISFSQRLALGGSTAWHDWAHTRPARLLPSLALQAGLSAGLVYLGSRRASISSFAQEGVQ